MSDDEEDVERWSDLANWDAKPAKVSICVVSDGINLIFKNGFQRFLSMREVKPGTRVALFNPLGDWELNEQLGALIYIQTHADRSTQT